jgi:serine/threonine protein kinase
VDVWSFAILMYECLMGKTPFFEEGKIDVQTSKLAAAMLAAGCMPQLVEIFKQCRQEDPYTRPTMATVADQVATLLVQDAHDSRVVKEELKVCLQQDRQAYDALWNLYESRMGGLLSLLATFATAYSPPKVRQPISSPGSFEALDALASKAPRLHENLEKIVVESGGRYIRGPRKLQHRLTQKVTTDYRGDYACLLDLERGTGSSESDEFFQRCLVKLRDSDVFAIVRVKDRLNNPLESGYRDVLLNIQEKSSGFVVELQLVLTKMADLKSQVHRFYELSRQMQLGAM